MSYYDRFASISELLGKTLESATANGDTLRFVTTEGITYTFLHEQDCCENVYIESIVGDLSDLVGEPILRAEEASNEDTPPPLDWEPESYTWTFYKFATRKGYVDVRWFGSSNGYYGEGVSIIRE